MAASCSKSKDVRRRGLIFKLVMDQIIALGYGGRIGSNTWIRVEDMMVAFYSIVVKVQNIKRALGSKALGSRSSVVACPTGDSGRSSRDGG